MKYVCPKCGNVSKEGLALGKGPWCARCGVEMKMDPRPTRVREDHPAYRRADPPPPPPPSL